MHTFPLRLGLAALTLGAAFPLAGAAGESPSSNWPNWRGPTADGISTETGLPIHLTPEATGIWKTAVPGRGHSSPVVWEGRIFLSSSITGGPSGIEPPVHIRDGEVYLHPGSTDGNLSHTLLALAYDAVTGAELWRRVLHDGPVYDNIYRTNTYASPTPLTDGERVYFYFGSEGFFALTLEGELVWRQDLGDIGSWGLGHGISPVLHQDLLILVCDDDGGEKSFLAAVDRRTGEVAWRLPRRVRKSWATPSLVPVGETTQLVVASFDRTAAYDPGTGAELWRAAGFDSNLVHTPVHGPSGTGRIVFASTGYPRKEMRAIRLDPGAPPETAWSHQGGTGYLPSALLYGGVLFFLSDGGIITALDPESGEELFQARPPTPGRYHASPVGYEGNVLIASLEGDLLLFRAARRFEPVAEGAVPEAVWASPAISAGSVFLRGAQHLYAFRKDHGRDPTGANR